MENKTHKFNAGDIVLTEGQFGKSKAIIECVLFTASGYAKYKVRFANAKKPKVYEWSAERFDPKSELVMPAGKLGPLLYGE